MFCIEIVSVRLRLGGRQASIQLSCSIGAVKKESQKYDKNDGVIMYVICNTAFELDNIGQRWTIRTTPQVPPVALV